MSGEFKYRYLLVDIPSKLFLRLSTHVIIVTQPVNISNRFKSAQSLSNLC